MNNSRAPTVSNDIYQSKHYYAFILKELKAIKSKTERAVKEGTASKEQLREIYTSYQIAIIGLIREGISYQYVKDTEIPENSLIRIKVDGVEYDCLNTAVKELLQDDYESVMGIPYDGPSLRDYDDLVKNQISAAIEESLVHESSAFFTASASVEKVRKKQKRYLKHFYLDLIEAALVIFIFMVMVNNPVVKHYADITYQFIQQFL